MTRVIFPVVKFVAEGTITCKTCGRKCHRRKTFVRTINPFNLNAEGEMKTYDEVQADNREAAKEWLATSLCKPCEDTANGDDDDDEDDD